MLMSTTFGLIVLFFIGALSIAESVARAQEGWEPSSQACRHWGSLCKRMWGSFGNLCGD